MNNKPYSQILNDVASDHVPHDLNLAPSITARIQKGKGLRMQPATKFISVVVFLAIVLAVLFYSVPAVAAALGQWFGYVPGVGLVREGSVRILAEPVSVTRDGITVTVDQVIINQERSTLLYSVEGLPNSTPTLDANERFCLYEAALRLPSGEALRASPNGVKAWDTGYQHRFDYAPLPTEVNDATLAITCLYLMHPGEAPENWEIPLRFIPAPPDMTVFPVIDIPSPTAPATAPAAAAATPTARATDTAAIIPTATTAGAANIKFTLDRAVQMDDGYLLYATLHWQDTPFLTVDVAYPEQTLHLLDGQGQPVAYEMRYDEPAGVNTEQRQTVFVIKTAPLQAPGALTLVLDAVSVELAVDASFVFDPGANPQAGQTWSPNQVITIGERSLRVQSIIANPSGYEVEMHSDSGIQNAGCADFEHTVVSGYGGGPVQGPVFGCGFNYENGLPNGPITITIGSISILHEQPLQVQWTLPAP